MTPNLLKDAKERGHGVHRSELRDAIPRLLQAGVRGWVRGDDQLRRLLLHPSVLLNEARDADTLFSEHLAERGQHAGAIVDADAVVRAGLDLTHGDHPDAVVEAERWAALHAAADRAREIDEVADHGRRGGPTAGTLADQEHLSHQVAFDEN